MASAAAAAAQFLVPSNMLLLPSPSLFRSRWSASYRSDVSEPLVAVYASAKIDSILLDAAESHVAFAQGVVTIAHSASEEARSQDREGALAVRRSANRASARFRSAAAARTSPPSCAAPSAASAA